MHPGRNDGGKDGGNDGGKDGGKDGGGATGVTAPDAEDAPPEIPYGVKIYTVNVYEVPLVSPVTVIGELDPDAVAPPGDAVTTYVTDVLLPTYAGGVKETVACAFPATAVTPVGTPGVPPAPAALPRIMRR